MQSFTLAAPGRAVVFGCLLCAVLSVTSIRPAHATFHLYQINELYSNADGSVQFIELHEAFGANGQNFLAGHIISVTQGPMTHSFTFPTNLPSSNTANTKVLIATPGFAGLGSNGGDVDYLTLGVRVVIGKSRAGSQGAAGCRAGREN